VKVKAQITNPLTIIAVYLSHLAMHYGLCVGAKMIYCGGNMCLRSYRESQDQFSNMPNKDRCRDVFRRLRGKSNEAIQEARNALRECIVEAPIAAAIPVGAPH